MSVDQSEAIISIFKQRIAGLLFDLLLLLLLLLLFSSFFIFFKNLFVLSTMSCCKSLGCRLPRLWNRKEKRIFTSEYLVHYRFDGFLHDMVYVCVSEEYCF